MLGHAMDQAMSLDRGKGACQRLLRNACNNVTKFFLYGLRATITSDTVYLTLFNSPPPPPLPTNIALAKYRVNVADVSPILSQRCITPQDPLCMLDDVRENDWFIGPFY